MRILGNFAEQLAGIHRQQATGKLVVTSDTQQWQLYFFLGRLLYVTGGEHRVRRWFRAVQHICPSWDVDFSHLPPAEPWEYYLLAQGIYHQQITLAQARAIVQLSVKEVLFSILAHPLLESEPLVDERLPCQIMLLPLDQVFQEVKQLQQQWQQADLNDINPHWVPMIQQPELLQRQVGSQISQNLTRLLDPQTTLWDLALKRQRSLVVVTHSLLGLLRSQMIQLQSIPDLPSPLPQLLPEVCPVPLRRIACIDDSPMIGETMMHLLQPLGYEVTTITNPLRAIATLLNSKPDLIFLDLVMPETNGYELCALLRRTSALQDVPIIILTSHDGIVDRMRARLSGASGFLSKPLDAQRLEEWISKFLASETVSAESLANLED